MKKTIIIKENDVKKLYPVTLTRPAFEINIGGYTLYSMIKEFFPEFEIVLEGRKEVMFNYDIKKEIKVDQSEIIEIDALTIPSIQNMNKIKEWINKKKEKINKGKKEKISESVKNEINDLEKINYPHEIIILNKKLCKENLDYIKKRFKKLNQDENEVYVGNNVSISKFVVFESSKGPIIIDDNSSIGPFSFIKGPVFIGKNSKINEHSSIKDNVIIGSVCKIGGEVEESIIMDYTNKQHYGYLGNSFVGSWVNLGAGTTTSDLKNTYGNIKVKDGLGNEINTNEQFLGSIIGDFTKTAINTSIYTGKIIGVNSAIYDKVKEDIGSFINYGEKDNSKKEFILQKAIETQKRIFKRRNITQTKKDIEFLEFIFEETKEDRN
jgi:UDP-N-acetylglucosamine diphosphorylase / glucose-1-phosphate thymidylyltransferase / UDP-N-acetylgalactosamine diphosphorylase / glucosamine-1-phosphate N-acetyltransferase / galactosamine-1-phosphate N-acetyltransferase